jgi:hypothetical protein
MKRWIGLLVGIVLMGFAALGWVKHRVEQAIVKPALTASSARILSKAVSTSAANADMPVVAEVLKPIGFGLTFGVIDSNLTGATVSLGCGGEPQLMDRPLGGTCDPHRGDTSCRTVLPVLCAKKAKLDASAGSDQAPDQDEVRDSLGATQPVMGAILESAAAASARCESELGAGWRMAESTDGALLQGQRGLGLGGSSRYWVHSKGAVANCWNSPP